MEISPVQQIEGEPPRRWFFAAESDLMVWLNGEGTPCGFQFAYDKSAEEHVLSWCSDMGYAHYRVDDGQAHALENQSPMMFANGPLRQTHVQALFDTQSALLPPAIAHFVSERIRHYDGPLDESPGHPLRPALPIAPQPADDTLLTLLASCELPTDDIAGQPTLRFFSMDDGDCLAACIGLEKLGNDALLRSLAVTPDLRGHGLARQLVAHAEAVAFLEDCHAVFLLTTTAASFFTRLGYRPLNRSDAPEPVRRCAQFTHLCPDSAALLTKPLLR